MKFKVKDHYYKQAKKDDFKARSVYKLKEINEKHRIIKAGDKVFDLGSSPGSWVQYISQVVKGRGLVVGIDIKEIKEKLADNFKFMHRSIYDLNNNDFVGLPSEFDVITSDMAPSTTGIKDVDQTASIELCEAAFNLCLTRLKLGGNFICKIFQSNELNEFKKQVKTSFKEVHLIKPKSTRSVSSEIFLVAKGYKRQ